MGNNYRGGREGGTHLHDGHGLVSSVLGHGRTLQKGEKIPAIADTEEAKRVNH